MSAKLSVWIFERLHTFLEDNVRDYRQVGFNNPTNWIRFRRKEFLGANWGLFRGIREPFLPRGFSREQVELEGLWFGL